MKITELKNSWLLEEEKTIKGWDFSYIANRTAGQELPWDYKQTVLSCMTGTQAMLDMGTGGGEFLVSLSPPPGRTYATEAYPPNVELCKVTLPAHGIDVRQVFSDDDLPFQNNFFDLVINRHESFSAQEVYRILKPGGVFVTQQVGGQNNRELSKFLFSNKTTIIDPEFNLKNCKDELLKSGFTISDEREYFPSLKFFDVGALVYFAKIIEWEFPGFSVEKCFEKLILLQEKMEKDGFVESTEHRFFLIAKK